jgi:predicted HicB family RNase H-like nuclease
MKQFNLAVGRDSKDETMAAVIKRGRGRPSRGLRKYIGFRVQEETAEEVAQVAAAKGITVSDYVSSAVARSLIEDRALRNHFHHQEELPIRIAS